MKTLPQFAGNYVALGLGAPAAPIIFDATHSVAAAGRQGTSSRAERQFVPALARAAAAVGIAGVFIEPHQDLDKAPSDGPNMLPLRDMEPLLRRLIALDKLVKTPLINNT